MKRDYNGWEPLFEQEFQKPYFQQLKAFLVEQYATKKVFPPKKLILNAFDLTAYDDVNVVILGQDPYINDGQAMGLSFSVPDGVRPPPSLQNIFKEIKQEYGTSIIKNGDLTPWAHQGVLLLNATLTVEAYKSNSHSNAGWTTFTDQVVKFLNQRERPMVFMLWGNFAISKKRFITNGNHLVLTAAHPSPLSAFHGFFGCGHFKKANEFLENFNKEIKW